MTDSSGNTITNKWDVDKGLLESVKTSNETDDQATKYAYDINTDNLLSVSKSVGLQTIINKYKYKYENDRIKAIEHNGFSYNFGYDALGSNTKVSVGTQDLISNEYEERSGKLKSSTYGNGQIVSNGYDSSTG